MRLLELGLVVMHLHLPLLHALAPHDQAAGLPPPCTACIEDTGKSGTAGFALQIQRRVGEDVDLANYIFPLTMDLTVRRDAPGRARRKDKSDADTSSPSPSEPTAEDGTAGGGAAGAGDAEHRAGDGSGAAGTTSRRTSGRKRRRNLPTDFVSTEDAAAQLARDESSDSEPTASAARRKRPALHVNTNAAVVPMPVYMPPSSAAGQLMHLDPRLASSGPHQPGLAMPMLHSPASLASSRMPMPPVSSALHSHLGPIPMFNQPGTPGWLHAGAMGVPMHWPGSTSDMMGSWPRSPAIPGWATSPLPSNAPMLPSFAMMQHSFAKRGQSPSGMAAAAAAAAAGPMHLLMPHMPASVPGRVGPVPALLTPSGSTHDTDNPSAEAAAVPDHSNVGSPAAAQAYLAAQTSGHMSSAVSSSVLQARAHSSLTSRGAVPTFSFPGV